MRVLILTPWPFRIPRNGGQLRAAAVKRAYLAAGHHVQSAGLYNVPDFRPDEVAPEDIRVTPGVIRIMQSLTAETGRSEMAFWKAAGTASDSVASFAATIQTVQPDVLQFEEPALLPVVRSLRQQGYLNGITVVHSSYNFETLAWQHRGVLGFQVTEETLCDIAAFEQEIADTCDLVVTVSEGDAAEFRRLGAERVCVAANGVASLPSPNIRTIGAYLPASMPYAVFISSAHPPNAHGLVDMAAAASGHPIRDGEIFIGGRVAALVRAATNYSRARRVLNRSRFLGWVDDAMLSALYAGARVVILPKLYSGGSNLKTAEALVSGRSVVATRRAFEGFEAFTDLPGVIIEDDADAFWNAVNDLLANNMLPSLRTPDALRGLLWQECLKPMVRAVEDLVLQRTPSAC